MLQRRKLYLRLLILYIVEFFDLYTICCGVAVMKCVFCSDDTKVLDKRTVDNVTRRRRECLKCKKRFTTYERADVSVDVVKKDGRREPFSREKILSGMLKACEKRPVTRQQIEDAIDRIENDLRGTNEEVQSKKIGEMVMKYLKKIDKIAYIRFASVYRSFEIGRAHV